MPTGTKDTMIEKKTKEKIAQHLARVEIMGVINATPDSFSDGGRNDNIDIALENVDKMLSTGAHIIDVGGESTRPFAEPVSLEEEFARVVPIVSAIALNFPQARISVDTYKAEVAEAALCAGATMINDISGGTFSPNMFELAAKFGSDIVIMHIAGTPKNMQQNPHYDNLLGEICDFLHKRCETARAAGVSADKIIIDPGIGFGKTFEHNLTLLNNVQTFIDMGYRVLIGASRKRFIGHYTNTPIAAERDAGSFAVASWVAAQGAHILRVHDVAGTVQCLRMFAALAC